MTTLSFSKMHGAANDFVVIDHRQPFLPADSTALFARLCDRRRGIGADGVLLLERDHEHDFAMRYHNADGGRAEFCGNGARCIARYALTLGLGRNGAVSFRTDAGVKRAQVREPGLIALWFGSVDDGEPRTLTAAGRRFVGRRVVTGVPHLVVPVEGLSRIPFSDWAPALRAHAELGPAGANVDFVERSPSGQVAMRTYERGVEGETLACGSGAIASALWAVVEAGAEAPVTVRTSGGDNLVVEFTRAHGQREAVLVGPAVSVFTGVWTEAGVQQQA
jgi:diaminopimelate epimerase